MPHNIEQVRAAIDNIDAQLITLLAERQSFVARAGEVKAGQGIQDAHDPVRVESILRARREQHALMGSKNQREAVMAGLEKRAGVFVDP